ncbi:MAG: rhomboid family intramembrane serine protease [Candidatus Aenigmarchaeota archaeon]|nr:rhomboid family intramembrane serine protease [Candidatus Aenigmarchaeota archaeon]
MKYSLILIAVITFVFVLQNIFPQITEEFSLSGFSRPYQLITSMFLHADLLHLGYNMIALFFFGLALEGAVGGRRFLLAYFATGITASIAAAAFYPGSLGASGAVFGVTGALVALRPKMTVFALGVPMPLVVAAVVWGSLDIIGVFYPSGIANFAHIAGLAVGLLLGLTWLRNFREKYAKSKPHNVLSDKEMDEWEKNWDKINFYAPSLTGNAVSSRISACSSRQRLST